MLNLEPYYTLVEDCIKSFGLQPEDCRTQKQGQWDLRKGSAQVWIDVFLSRQNNDYGYLQIMSPIIKLPEARREEFYREMLELNHSLYGVGFTVNKEWVYIKGIRELEGLSLEEAAAMLNRVGTYADEYDDLFKKKYDSDNLGGSRAPVA
jgi:hypothetical protein